MSDWYSTYAQRYSDSVWIPFAKLEAFMKDVLVASGVPEADAETIGEVLIESDRRGIDSHGIGRLKPIYIDRIDAGILDPVTRIEVLKDEKACVTLDGHNGMGHVVAKKAMEMAIAKAKEYGLGMAAVRNSTHYGIAGYYVTMATKEGMIGVTGTNARPSIAPTHGVENMLGTNPLTFGLPTDEDFPFVIDFLCGFAHLDPTAGTAASDHNLAYVLAAFHTGFNLCNAALFIGWVKPLERWATQRVGKPRNSDEKQSELRFITKGLLDTPEESVMEARKEIINYTDTVTQMFTQTRYLFSADNETDFKNIFTLVEHYEEISDEMETDIANYLNRITAEEDVPASLRPVICGMLRELAEIESIGDSCHHIAHTARRNFYSSQPLTEAQLEHIHQMFQLTEQALEQMRTLLFARKPPRECPTAYYIEKEINNYRNQLRNLNFADVNRGLYSYQTGAMYMDVINECEQLSDCIINVTEARIEAQGG